MRLDGSVALVTGAGGGIGAATAQRLAAEGARIAVLDLTPDGVEQTVQAIQAAGGEAAPFLGDVSKGASIAEAVQKMVDHFGRLDILINNAGINRDAMAVKMTEDQWDQVLNVNLKGSWLTAQAVQPHMRAQNSGRIVNTASISALGNIGQANYSASKAGIIGLTRTLALEWARYGIRVNCVAPGATETRMTAGIPDAIRADLTGRIPLKRMARPEEIASVHAFLVSEDSSYITGQVIFVDGGVSLG